MNASLSLVLKNTFKKCLLIGKHNQINLFKFTNYKFCDITSNNNIRHGKCFKCGKPGHISRECTEKENISLKGRRSGQDKKNENINNETNKQK